MMRRPHNHIYHEIVTSPLLCGYRDAHPVCLLASAVPGSRTRCAPGTVARSARELASKHVGDFEDRGADARRSAQVQEFVDGL